MQQPNSNDTGQKNPQAIKKIIFTQTKDKQLFTKNSTLRYPLETVTIHILKWQLRQDGIFFFFQKNKKFFLLAFLVVWFDADKNFYADRNLLPSVDGS